MRQSKPKNEKSIEGHRHSSSVQINDRLIEELKADRVPVTEHSPANRKSDAYGTADRNSQNNQ